MIDLAHAAMAGLMQGGVAPVIKHIPGHGRAMVDSHLALPTVKDSLAVLSDTDFRPFKALNMAPMAMTAHIVYEAVDKSEALTLSERALSTIVRAEIGFDGLLMSDDLDMKALTGNSLTDKTERALAAGCDIALHCSGDMPAMIAVAKGAKTLSGRAQMRAEIARSCASAIEEFDRAFAEAEFKRLMPRLSAVS